MARKKALVFVKEARLPAIYCLKRSFKEATAKKVKIQLPGQESFEMPVDNTRLELGVSRGIRSDEGESLVAARSAAFDAITQDLELVASKFNYDELFTTDEGDVVYRLNYGLVASDQRITPPRDVFERFGWQPFEILTQMIHAGQVDDRWAAAYNEAMNRRALF